LRHVASGWWQGAKVIGPIKRPTHYANALLYEEPRAHNINR